MNRSTTKTTIATLLAVTGAAASVALAQPYVVNISGASLLENYVKAPASTNDFIDVDGDGRFGFDSVNFTVDQLAPALSGSSFNLTTPSNSNHYFVVQYRVTGSINGFNELTRWGSTFVTSGENPGSSTLGIIGAPTVSGGSPTGGAASVAYANRTPYIGGTTATSGLAVGAYNSANAGGAPYRSDVTTLVATYAAPGTASAGGVRIDLAPLDVPTRWAVTTAGTPAWNKIPGTAGYGANALTSKNRTGGTAGANASNALLGLNGRNLFDPSNPGSANANTLFDNPLSFAPIAPVTNFGTGWQQVTITELQHLFGTGRASTGENLVIITRDVGSGTRNAFQNCIGQDPSYGVGDNVGAVNTQADLSNYGTAFVPSNKGSNGVLEATLRNARLGIGYVGTERGVTGSGSGSWMTSNALDILSTKNDIYGGTAYARPTTTNLVHNTNNGWIIGGPAIIASLGDPLAESVADGGEGRTTPRMPNPHAAKYLNNITKSIAAFNGNPDAIGNIGMPGEFAATQFILTSALDRVHNFVIPTQMDTNPALNVNVQNTTLASNVHNSVLYTSFNTTTAGKAPTRKSVTGYSDDAAVTAAGGTPGTVYVSQGGSTITYGNTLSLRNKIAGDFDGNGLRNVNDAGQLMTALRSRNGGPAWTAPAGTGTIAGAPGTDACIEILGDFDCDGSFNLADARYFADGLALNATTGKLDRKAGFTAIDTANVAAGGSLNTFTTTLATGKPYAAGDARGDVAKSSGDVAKGWAPVGFDGAINALDINYVYRQFKQNAVVTDGEANWSNIGEAVSFDLSADMTGDLKVNQDDVIELVTVILGTSMCDVNLDGTVNAADRTVIVTNSGTNGGWAQGDLDGDGQVNAADLAIIDACLGPVCNDLDFNNDGNIEPLDVDAYFSILGEGPCLGGTTCDSLDFNNDGNIEPLDVDAYFSVLGEGPCF